MFMSLGYSKPVWDLIGPLGYLQFPWRFLLFAALFSSLLAGNLIFQLRYTVLKVALSIIMVAALIYFNLKLFRPQEYRFNQSDNQETSYEQIAWYVSQTSFEYLPAGIDIHELQGGGYLPNLTKADIYNKHAHVTEGYAGIETISQNSFGMVLKTTTQDQSTIQINKANFPGWQVTIDGKKVPVSSSNPLKLITINVPPGIHIINAQFKNTITAQVANMVSTIAIIILFLSYVKYARRH